MIKIVGESKTVDFFQDQMSVLEMVYTCVVLSFFNIGYFSDGFFSDKRSLQICSCDQRENKQNKL